MDRPDDVALLAEAEKQCSAHGCDGVNDGICASAARPDYVDWCFPCLLAAMSAALRAALQREQEMREQIERLKRQEQWTFDVATGRRTLLGSPARFGDETAATHFLPSAEAAERELSTLRARTEQEDGAGLIHQAIPDMAGTEPRPDTGIPRIPNVWENAAVAAGRVDDFEAAVLADHDAQTRQDWQPIEAAKQDGTWYAFTSTWNQYARWCAHFEDGAWRDKEEHPQEIDSYTHCMPLPAPPAQKGTK